jgi:hypothetical protein
MIFASMGRSAGADPAENFGVHAIVSEARIGLIPFHDFLNLRLRPRRVNDPKPRVLVLEDPRVESMAAVGNNEKRWGCPGSQLFHLAVPQGDGVVDGDASVGPTRYHHRARDRCIRREPNLDGLATAPIVRLRRHPVERPSGPITGAASARGRGLTPA